MANEVKQTISLLDTLPPVWPEELLDDIRSEIASSTYKIVILDDDPTGTQTAQNLPVLTTWTAEALREELLSEYPAFFILTNSRSLSETEACRLADEVGKNLIRASEQTGVRVIPISRSDSTLRGHFPGEVDAMARSIGKEDLPYLLLPFFLEGGRYTINDIHYVQEGDELIPAADTPFAADAAFGFTSSNLKEWVAEKTAGRIKAENVRSISLNDIRTGGPEKVSTLLQNIPAGTACIVNLASYRDLEVLVRALLTVEKNGKEFLYRTAASFVRTRTGLDPQTRLLTRNELLSNSSYGGLFIIGSYVKKTSLQVEALLAETDIVGVEISVEALLSPDKREQEIERVTTLADNSLKASKDCAIFTSRELVAGEDAHSSLDIGQTVSECLVEIVRSIKRQPRYLIAKGGITSSDVATKGLKVKRAIVTGQPLPGVPAWQLGPETKFPGMTYIVFPGNVGDNNALVHLKNIMGKQEIEAG